MIAEKTARTDIHMGEGERLSLQPMADLVKVANNFRSDIVLETGTGGEADAKSLMQVFLFFQRYGNAATVRARGPDATEAVDAIRHKVSEPGSPGPDGNAPGAGP